MAAALVKDEPTGYNKYDRVRQETQWRERVREEAARHQKGRNFQLNLIRPTPAIDQIRHSHNRFEIVTDKEHKEPPSARSQLGDFSETSFEVQTIKHLEKRPVEKWDIPSTTYHDIGWLLSRPCRADDLMKTSTASGSKPLGSLSMPLSTRSETVPTLTEGKWTPRSPGEGLKCPANALPDISRLNTP